VSVFDRGSLRDAQGTVTASLPDRFTGTAPVAVRGSTYVLVGPPGANNRLFRVAGNSVAAVLAEPVTSFAVNRGSGQLVVAALVSSTSFRVQLRVLDAATGRTVLTGPYVAGFATVMGFGGTSVLVTAGPDGSPQVLRWQVGGALKSLDGFGGAFALSPDGQSAVLARTPDSGCAQLVKLASLTTGPCVLSSTLASFSPSGDVVAAVSANSMLQRLTVATGALTTSALPLTPTQLVWSGPSVLATGISGRQIRTLRCDPTCAQIGSAASSPDGNYWLVVGG
jgi:hypothetical protein